MEFQKGDLVRITRDHSSLVAGEETLVIDGPHPSYSDTGEYMKAHYLAEHEYWGNRVFNVLSAYLKAV